MSQDMKFVIWTFVLVMFGYAIPNETIIGKAISLVCFAIAVMRMAKWMFKK